MPFGNQYRSLTDEKFSHFRKYFEDLHVCVIDEISMVGADKIYDISKRFQELFINQFLYGGLCVYFFGDPMQLEAVKAKKSFSEPSSYQNKALFYSDDNLWKNMKSVVLETNFRQGEAAKWTMTLNRIRFGEQNEEDLQLLDSRRIKHFSNRDLGNALHAFYTNKEVENLNTIKLNELDSPLVTKNAIIEGPKSYKPKIKDHGTIADSSFMKTLKVKVGARVMLVYNICIADSLVNGVTGEIIEILWTNKERNLIRAIVVKFDNEEVGSEKREKNKHLSPSIRHGKGVPIFTSTCEFQIPGRNPNNKHGSKCRVTQFPLRLAWAFTAHKLQGVTLKKGTDLICHGHVKLPKGMGYVMLSRCEKLDNVFLDDEFDLAKIVCDPMSKLATKQLEKNNIVNEMKSKQFDIFYVNIRSLQKHMIDLQSDIFVSQSKIICLSETWMNPGLTFNMENKVLHHASKGKYKGVCVFTPTGNDYEFIYSVAEEYFQIVSISIENKFQLICMYLSKDAPLQEVIKHLKISKKLVPIIAGDFNFDKNDVNFLSSHMKILGLTQVIMSPSHEDGNTIDHIYLPSTLKDSVTVNVRFVYFSDHASITVNFN